TYTNAWTVGASGAPGSPVRIAVDAANSNHNGRVIFDYNYAGDLVELTAVTAHRDYITFDGNVGGERRLIFSNLKHYLDKTAAVAISADSSTGIVIDHVAFTNVNNAIGLVYGTGFRVS